MYVPFPPTVCTTKCSYKITGLDPQSPYGVLLVAANSATDDSTCINDTTTLGSRYLVFIVGTDDVAGWLLSQPLN